MNLKLGAAALLSVAIATVAHAQQSGPPANAPKPSMADVQKLVQAISSDKAKVKTYCDIGKLQEQMEQAEQKKDTKAVDALGVKADALAKQLGPDYEKVMGGLDQLDPNSPEGRRYGALFQPLFKQCK
jgi:protein-disulfide isomerase